MGKGKKSQKTKFVSVKEFEEKHPKVELYSVIRQERPSYSGSTFTSRSSRWPSDDVSTSRENTGSWRRDTDDRSDRDNISRNKIRLEKVDIEKVESNNSVAENSENKVTAPETSSLWCDEVGSLELMSGNTEVANSSYNIEDVSAGVTEMGLEQANSSRSNSNLYGKDSNSGSTSEKEVWRTNDSKFSNWQNGKDQRQGRYGSYDNQRQDRNESYDNQRQGRYGSYENQRRDRNESYDNQRQGRYGNYENQRRDRTESYENQRQGRNDSSGNQRWGRNESFENQRQGRNESYDGNIESNWRQRDTTNKGSSRVSHTDVAQTTEVSKDPPDNYESEPRPNTRDKNSRDYQKEGPRTYGNYNKKQLFGCANLSEEQKGFNSFLDSREAENFKKVKEEERDLFQVGKDYALAHCVAEDMNMGSGIAVEFRVRFKKVAELLNQYATTGGLAFLKIEDQYIYYLVTKARSQGKPTYDTLWSSLIELRTHIKTNEVKKLAIPLIGCGLDRLDWNIVKPMLEYLFRNEDLEILVCNLQVDGPSTSPAVKKCKIIYESKAITEIEPATIIIYFASKDGEPTEAMTNLDKKFMFASHFQKAPKNIGETIRLVPTTHKNYILYGCIVKDKLNDPFDFNAFEKCLRTIIKNYKLDNFYYIAFQQTPDESLNIKILNLMKNSLRDMEIYVCGNLEPQSNIEE